MAYDLGTAHGTVEIDYDGRAAILAAKKDVKSLRKEAKDSDGDLKKFGSTLKKLGAGVAKGGGIALLVTSLTNAGVAAAAASIQVLGMVPPLLQLGSLAAGLPAAFVALGGVLGVVKTAFLGVGDALSGAFSDKATDVKKFEESLKGLAPSARAFAKTFKSDLVPGLRAFQQGIQQAFFSTNLQSLFPRITASAKQLSPTLQGIAKELSTAAKNTASFALSADSIGFVRQALGLVRLAIQDIAKAVQPLLKGFIDVGRVGLNIFESVANGIGVAARSFGQWMSAIAQSGQLQTWISGAIDTLFTLGGIVKNVGSILSSVFGTAAATGGGLLNTLQDLTGSAASFLKSAEGSEALTSAFSGILALARQLSPILTTVAGALGKALGPALAQIATQVGPQLLSGIQQLAPALTPVAGALADVATAVAPLLPPLGKLIGLLAKDLAAGLTALASEIGPIVEIFGGAFLTALNQLEPVLDQLISQALPQAAALGTQMAAAFAPLVPVIVQTAGVIAQSLVPLLPVLANMVQAVAPAVVVAVQAFVLFTTAGLKVVQFLVQLVAGVVGFVNNVRTFFGQLPGIISGAFTAAYNFVASLGGQIITWLTALPGKIGAALAALPGLLVGVIKTAMTQGAFAIGAGIGTLITLAYQAPGKIRDGFMALIGFIRSVATSAWNTAKAAFSSGIAAVIGFVNAAPQRIGAALNALPGILRGAASSAMNSFRSAFSSGVATVQGLAHTLPGRIKAGLGNLGSLLLQAGHDVVVGLANGIKGAVGAAVSAAVGVGREVIDGIKSTLKIGSPSKVTFEFGGWTGEGMVLGLLDKIRAVRNAAQSLANAVIQPTLGFRAGAGAVAERTVASSATAGTGAGVTLNQTVNALPGMSARDVSNFSASKLALLVRTGTAAVSIAAPMSQEA